VEALDPFQKCWNYWNGKQRPDVAESEIRRAGIQRPDLAEPEIRRAGVNVGWLKEEALEQPQSACLCACAHFFEVLVAC
jgi:hypothetical protein